MKYKQPHLGQTHWSYLGYLSAINFLTVILTLHCFESWAQAAQMWSWMDWSDQFFVFCTLEELQSVCRWWIWGFGLLLLIYIVHGKSCVCPGKCSLLQAWHHLTCFPWIIQCLGLAAESREYSKTAMIMYSRTEFFCIIHSSFFLD